MTKLINTPLFKSILIASCMLTSDVPAFVPPCVCAHDDPKDEPKVMKVSHKKKKPQPSSSSKKRFRSVVDSGATIHCIKDRSLFTHLDTSASVRVRVADKHVIHSAGVGTCAINLTASDGSAHTVLLHNCVYSPLFGDNLISTRRLWLDNKMSSHMG